MHTTEGHLDALVASADTHARAAGTSPHAAMWGAALLAVPVVTGVAALHFAERAWVPPVVCITTLFAYHRAYLPLKQALVPGGRRQLLVDLVLFVLPVFLTLTTAIGESLPRMADLTACVLPVGVALLRTGCLLGGCCHGVAHARGVRYPGRSERVVPLPLFEALAAVGSGVAILVLPAREGALLPHFLALYCAYRFGAEFLRAPDVGRVGGLTRSQWLAAATALVAGLAW